MGGPVARPLASTIYPGTEYPFIKRHPGVQEGKVAPQVKPSIVDLSLSDKVLECSDVLQDSWDPAFLSDTPHFIHQVQVCNPRFSRPSKWHPISAERLTGGACYDHPGPAEPSAVNSPHVLKDKLPGVALWEHAYVETHHLIPQVHEGFCPSANAAEQVNGNHDMAAGFTTELWTGNGRRGWLHSVQRMGW